MPVRVESKLFRPRYQALYRTEHGGGIDRALLRSPEPPPPGPVLSVSERLRRMAAFDRDRPDELDVQGLLETIHQNGPLALACACAGVQPQQVKDLLLSTGL